jgi:hypothetical protein
MRHDVRPRAKERHERETQAQAERGTALQEARAPRTAFLAPKKLAKEARAEQLARRELAEVERLAARVRGPAEEALVREADEGTIVGGAATASRRCSGTPASGSWSGTRISPWRI